MTAAEQTHKHKWTYYRESGKEKRVCVGCNRTQKLGNRDRFRDGSMVERWDDTK